MDVPDPQAPVIDGAIVKPDLPLYQEIRSNLPFYNSPRPARRAHVTGRFNSCRSEWTPNLLWRRMFFLQSRSGTHLRIDIGRPLRFAWSGPCYLSTFERIPCCNSRVWDRIARTVLPTREAWLLGQPAALPGTNRGIGPSSDTMIVHPSVDRTGPGKIRT
jgi:hypothetical protein